MTGLMSLARGYRCCAVWAVAFGVTGGYADTLQAQTCIQVSPPAVNYEFEPRGSVTAGGEVAMLLIADNSPETAAAEVALFNPRTNGLRFFTANTPSVLDSSGTRQRFTKRVAGLARNGSLIAISGSAFVAFTTLQLPGQPGPAQVAEVFGVPGPIELINTQTGARQVIGTLGNVPPGPNQIYIGRAVGFSSDASKVLIDEVIVQVQPTVVDGVTRLIVPNGAFVASASGLLNIATGQIELDIAQRINQLAGNDPRLIDVDGALLRMSGDGNAFIFASRRDLANPQRPLWSQISAGGANIGSAPYVYFRDVNQILPVVSINTSQARLGGSGQVFLRNIGQTGTVFGIERGASYIGAPANPSGANNPATLVLGEVPRYITPPTAQPPTRGFFANSFALIAPEEDRVYFQHTADLVPGRNPNQAQALFSIELQNRQIRQISDPADTLGLRFANEPAILFQYGDTAQLVYAGSSADHKVVAYRNSRPGIFLRSVKEVDAQGRVTLRLARFGTAEYPASLNFPIMVCP